MAQEGVTAARAYPSLTDNEIHIWHLDLRELSCLSAGMFNRLSAEEKLRAVRFCFFRDREMYSISRGALRHILGTYLGARPEAVKFSLGPHGKPQLDEHFSGMAIQFNVSHSRSVALIAVARGMAVGIDVECVRPLCDAGSIAQSHFSAKEREDLSRLPVSKMTEGFFSCWTRKEAFVKALGGGLSIPLNSFCVSTRSGEGVELLDENGNSKETIPWKVMDLRFEEDGTNDTYVGALVGPGTNWHASVRNWQPPCQ